MTTGDNIWYTIITPAHDGYVFSMSVGGADREMKDYVLNEDGYEWLGEKYAKRAKAEREAALLKAKDLVSNPRKYTRATSYCAAKYVKKIDFDKDTGEILKEIGTKVGIDFSRKAMTLSEIKKNFNKHKK